MTVSFTFVTAFRRLRLNRSPSVLYLTCIPPWQSWKAYVSMVEDTVLKSVGARTQPCFTPFITGKASEWSQSSGTLSIMQSLNCRTIVVILLKRLSYLLQAVSAHRIKGLSQVNEGHKEVAIVLGFFSWSWRAANIILAVPRSERKPYSLSWRRHWARFWMRRLSRMRSKILLARDRGEIPR